MTTPDDREVIVGMQLPVGALRYHNFMHRHYDFTIQRYTLFEYLNY